MKWRMTLWIGAASLAAPFACADVPQAARSADVVFLGEVHDNPSHHMTQAEWVRALAPKAIVFEMVPRDVDPADISDSIDDPAALGDLLNWDDRGWPDFSMYYPIFQAAPDALFLGAEVPRDQVRAIMAGPLVDAFGADAVQYDLDQDLSADQQSKREALQFAAHCGALPESMLPMMVDVQRLRDAVLAQVTLRAHNAAGQGAVAVITGNGHARLDWGAPAVLKRVAPDIVQFTLGQSEEGRAPDGGFDLVLSAPAIERPDPCDAFRDTK